MPAPAHFSCSASETESSTSSDCSSSCYPYAYTLTASSTTAAAAGAHCATAASTSGMPPGGGGGSSASEEFVGVSDGEASHVFPSAMTSVPHGSPRRGVPQVTPAAPSGSPSKHITVVDVYDLASSIGKDFEKLVERHGHDTISSIMPKVISALETLESLAANNDAENERIATLEKQVEYLEKDRALRAADRLKLEADLELVEDSYRKEIAELRQMVQSLVSENRTLSSTVSSMPSPFDMAESQHAQDVDSILALKEEGHRQREEIRQLKAELGAQSKETDNMQSGIDRLIRQNEELLRKNGSLQKQGRQIVEEKTELFKRLVHAEEINISLRKSLKEKDRECRELEDANGSDSEPRFTLAELREVLQEKNILKGRVMELEEEMEHIRCGVQLAEDLTPTTTAEATSSTADYGNDDDRPVQGPLPREPAEKVNPWLFQRKESGIRRFFTFFKDISGMGGAATGTASPRRNSSRGSSVTNSPRTIRSTTVSSLAAGN